MSTLSIAPYFPFPRVVPIHQEVSTVDGGATRTLITFAVDPAEAPRCSACGASAAPVHSYHVRRVRDLGLAHAQVEVVIPHRKVRCAQCGPRMEAHEFLAPFRRATRRFERAVEELCRVLSVQQVAEHFGLAWHTVKDLDKHRLEREVGTPCYAGLRLLAIDEISVHKGHRYLTNVMDLETGRIVWSGPDHSKATLRAFFGELTGEERASIQAVAIDMHAAYRDVIQEQCPAAAIVYDFFHVVAHYGREVIDRVRLDEARTQDKEGRRYINGSRYLLLRNRENLRDDQRERLDELLAVNAALNTVYVLKDQLKAIWAERTVEAARQALHAWCALAEASTIAPLIRFARNLRGWEEGIVAHARYPIHTGRLEGMHNKIQVIKRQAYGFRDDRYFMLKIKAAFPGHLHPDQR